MAGTEPGWYRDAIIYAVDVANFSDSNGDGIGDFPGLTARLDYLAELGVTCLWLLPFYPTPNRDNGYDIIDYTGIDPRLGTFDDLRVFRHAANERGIRLIFDLVIHHTSDQHPWFHDARSDPDSPYRPYYVWTDQPPAESGAVVVFPGVEESAWTYDASAGAYYLHQFYAFEPDLNVEHPPVGEEVQRIIAFWCEHGANGLRVDAASHLLGTQALLPQPTAQPHAFVRQIRAALDDHTQHGVLIAEADVEATRLRDYFGDGMNLLFNFLLNNYFFLALARGEAEPIQRGLALLPQDTPEAAQWANFLRNNDELDLEQLSDDEQQEVFRAFAPEERMRVYGRGIRRRLAPMLGGDQRRIALAYSLLFSLPGTPVLVYGDEIGMGDDLSLPERESVRLAMPWADAPNGGFSTAPRQALAVPILEDGPFSYHRVNVRDQRADPASLFNCVRRMNAARAACPVFGRGQLRVVVTGHPAVFAHRVRHDAGEVLAVHNLSDQPCRVSLPLNEPVSPLLDLLTETPGPPVSGGQLALDLPPYGYRWLRLRAAPAASA